MWRPWWISIECREWIGVQNHFASKSPQKTSAQLKRQHAELIKNLPAGTHMDDRMLQVATSMQMVRFNDCIHNCESWADHMVHLVSPSELCAVRCHISCCTRAAGAWRPRAALELQSLLHKYPAGRHM